MTQNKKKKVLQMKVAKMNLKNQTARPNRIIKKVHEETDADSGDIDEDAIVDENQEITDQSIMA